MSNKEQSYHHAKVLAGTFFVLAMIFHFGLEFTGSGDSVWADGFIWGLFASTIVSLLSPLFVDIFEIAYELRPTG